MITTIHDIFYNHDNPAIMFEMQLLQLSNDNMNHGKVIKIFRDSKRFIFFQRDSKRFYLIPGLIPSPILISFVCPDLFVVEPSLVRLLFS